MDLQPETKIIHSHPNDSSEFPLHQPTLKGIQLPRNWFTDWESEHSPCNGQAKSLQYEKGKLTNDKNPLSFLMKSFY